MTRYPKSRLPGPAVRLFELELEARERDPDATVRGPSSDTLEIPLPAQRMLRRACKETL